MCHICASLSVFRQKAVPERAKKTLIYSDGRVLQDLFPPLPSTQNKSSVFLHTFRRFQHSHSFLLFSSAFLPAPLPGQSFIAITTELEGHRKFVCIEGA